MNKRTKRKSKRNYHKKSIYELYKSMILNYTKR